MDKAVERKILEVLDRHRIMTIATLQPDGWPRTTTVGYASRGLALYFLCGPDSPKAANLARDDRVSLSIDHDRPDSLALTSLSITARAHPVFHPAEVETVLRLMPLKYPPGTLSGIPMPTCDQVRIFKVTPVAILVQDHSRGYAHTDFVTC